MKSLKANEVKEALNEIFKKQKPTLARSNGGSEFTNGIISNFLKQLGIKQIVTIGEKKANYAERAIRTIKLKLAQYMTQNQTHKWYDQLQNITSSYNKTYHRTIKMSPMDALSTNDSILWKNQYGWIKKSKHSPPSKKSKKRYFNPSPYKFKVGDTVKISTIKNRLIVNMTRGGPMKFFQLLIGI